MKRKVLAVALTGIASSTAAMPLDEALRTAGGSLCFTRSYDAQWMKANAGQTVRKATLSLSDSGMVLLVQSKGAPLLVSGACQWDDDLNRGVQGDILDPTFKATSGLGCMISADPTFSSAEEGGEIQIEWGGNYIQAHLSESLAGWRSFDTRRRGRFYKVRKADQVIRLYPAPAAHCRDLDAL